MWQIYISDKMKYGGLDDISLEKVKDISGLIFIKL